MDIEKKIAEICELQKERNKLNVSRMNSEVNL